MPNVLFHRLWFVYRPHNWHVCWIRRFHVLASQVFCALLGIEIQAWERNRGAPRYHAIDVNIDHSPDIHEGIRLRCYVACLLL